MSIPGNTSCINKLNNCESEKVNFDKTLILIALINIEVSSSYEATLPSFIYN